MTCESWEEVPQVLITLLALSMKNDGRMRFEPISEGTPVPSTQRPSSMTFWDTADGS